MRSILISLFALSSLACGSDRGVSVAVAVPQSSALIQSSSADGLALGNDSELVISSAEIVLREIEFEREGESDCDDGDSCEEVEAGPRLVSLPLDGSVDVEITAELPEGVYNEIELDVHKVADSDDPEFVAANSDLLRVSVRVRGTWHGEAFTFTSDLDEEREIQLDDNPIVVGAGGAPVGVTLSLDVATWFTDDSGHLIDPRTANEGGDNESRVETNIKSSIDGFEDDDHDGVEDDHED